MKSFFGGLLLAIGILIAGLSGLCSLLFLGDMMTSRGGQSYIDLPAILIIGGIPFAIGAGMFFFGRRLLRTAKKPDQTDGSANVF